MKKSISILLALMLLASAPIHAADPFPDVRHTDWFASYAQSAKDLGIVSGYPDGTFQPARLVTYGEFLAMAMRGRGLPRAQQSHWAAGFYDAAIASGVFDATQISSRFLDEPIPRQDMALVMAGLLDAANLSGRNVRTADRRFSDVAVQDEREYPIALCAYYGVLAGYPDGTFRPLGFLTRAEAAAAMVALDGVLQRGSAPASLTREELLEQTEALVRTGDAQVLSCMAPEASAYLQSVVTSARFVKEGGAYLARISWPDLPEGYGVKIDVQVCDASGTGLDGMVWVCREGMEAMPTYEESLKSAGSAEYAFSKESVGGAGSVSLLVSLTKEGEDAESSLALAQQDLRALDAEVQYRLASENYRISGTFSLPDGVFQWK